MEMFIAGEYDKFGDCYSSVLAFLKKVNVLHTLLKLVGSKAQNSARSKNFSVKVSFFL